MPLALTVPGFNELKFLSKKINCPVYILIRIATNAYENITIPYNNVLAVFSLGQAIVKTSSVSTGEVFLLLKIFY